MASSSAIVLLLLSFVASSTAALYYQTNDPVKNQVVAVGINPMTGALTNVSRVYNTGGKGGAAITNVTTNATAAVDGLFAQGAVATGDGDAGMLFAVNAGSNTLSMFKIDPEDPTKLSLVGKPMRTLGTFPVSVAYSKKLRTACVLNGGAKDGVACFKADVRYGLSPLDKGPRPLHLGQTTPPSGPPGSASQIMFNPQSTLLYVVVKGIPNVRPGYLKAYHITSAGTVSTASFNSSFSGANILFGTAFANNSRLVITDPSVGAHVVDVVKQTMTEVGVSTIKGSKAICWSAYSTATKTAFLADGGVGRLTEIDPFGAVPGATVGLVTPPGNFTGFLDLAVSGSHLYALAPRNGTIAAFDISGGKGMAKYLPGRATRPVPLSATGLATYPIVA